MACWGGTLLLDADILDQADDVDDSDEEEVIPSLIPRRLLPPPLCETTTARDKSKSIAIET